MNAPSNSSIAERLADNALITAAIQKAVREAVLRHARAGNPVADWQNGRVVWVSPEEVLASLASESPTKLP